MYQPFNVLILFGLLFFNAQLSLAQKQDMRERDELDKNYQIFRDFFESNIKQDTVYSTLEIMHFDFLHPERLPAWVFENHQPKNDSFYIVAASDPGMDPEKGLELAKYRAMIMYALSGKVIVSNMREQYMQEISDVQYNIYSEFSTFESNTKLFINEVEVIKLYVTQYDETIILAGISEKNESETQDNLPFWRANSELFTRVARTGTRIQLNEQLRIDLTPSEQITASNYSHQYAKINRIVNSQTFLHNDLVSDLPAINLRYILPAELVTEPDIDLKAEQGYSLRHGLWHAMLNAMLSRINDEAHKGSIQFSQLGDVYDRTMTFISNELVSTSVRLSVPKIHVIDNELYLIF